MVDISRKTYATNGVKTTVNSDGILWLNEKYVEEGLNHKNAGDHSKIFFRPKKTYI